MTVSTGTRRTLLTTASWSIPAAAISVAAPAYAGSPQPPKRSGDYGLFVTTTALGDRMGNENATSILANYAAADTPEESFRNGSTWVEPDKNWDDANRRPISPTPPYHNGEGSYTPAGNAGGNNGSYVASTGFWFSSPTKTPGTGTGYTGTATLQPGAVFSSKITIVAMPGNPTQYATNRTRELTGNYTQKLTDVTNSHNPYMVKSQAAGTLALKPGTERTYVNDQGRNVWEGIVTFTTTTAQSTTAKKPFTQVKILPYLGSYFDTTYSWTTTSWVDSATITYSTGATSTVLSNQALKTTSFVNK